MTTSETNVKIPDEFNDDTDFWQHPVCNNYEANRLGIVRNIKSKNEVRHKTKDGYYQIVCGSDCCRGDKKIKHYRKQRFIYECFFGLIKDNRVVGHINNIRTDNRLQNLQLLTNSENSKKDYKHHNLQPIKVRATNIESGDYYDYDSITKAARDLDVQSSNISKIFKNLQKTCLSKTFNQRFRFEKLPEKKLEQKPLIIKNKVNIKIYKNNNSKININDKKLLPPSKKDD